MKSRKIRSLIVVVEDDQDLRELLEELLGELNDYTIRSASNGLEGLETILQNHCQVALIITDYAMPKCNGGEMLSELDRRGNPGLARVPRIIMSSMDREDYPESGKYTDWLRKPVDPPGLLKAIRETLVNHRLQ